MKVLNKFKNYNYCKYGFKLIIEEKGIPTIKIGKKRIFFSTRFELSKSTFIYCIEIG